jgi:hypothetical protein
MKITAVTRVQLGFSVAAVSVLTITAVELLIHVAVLGSHPGLVCGGLGGTGFFIWVAGRAGRGADDVVARSLAWLGEPRYWGLLFALAALLAYCFNVCRRSPTKPLRSEVTQTVLLPPPKVSFPPLKLNAIIYQGVRSSALINGKVLRQGEEVSRVQVVAISSDHVLVALEGQTNSLYLGASGDRAMP